MATAIRPATSPITLISALRYHTGGAVSVGAVGLDGLARRQWVATVVDIIVHHGTYMSVLHEWAVSHGPNWVALLVGDVYIHVSTLHDGVGHTHQITLTVNATGEHLYQVSAWELTQDMGLHGPSMAHAIAGARRRLGMQAQA